MIMPARSARTAVSGVNGAFSRMVIVEGSTTSTPATLDSSLRRADASSVM
jgi:hypothetical protein